MIRLPDLESGQAYTRIQVARYLAPQGDQTKHRSDDYSVAVSGFPHADASRWSFDHEMDQPKVVVVMEYHLFPFQRFAGWLVERQQVPLTDEDTLRMKQIEQLIESGEPAFPVWVEKHQVDLEPIPVREGQHRILVFAKLAMPEVPVFLTKYGDHLSHSQSSA